MPMIVAKVQIPVDPGLPPLYIPTQSEPVSKFLESEKFFLEAFNPYFNKRHGLSGPAMPKTYVWDTEGNLRPGWGGFMKELGKHSAKIAFIQHAALHRASTRASTTRISSQRYRAS
jgi:hypothetical protein